MAKIDGVQEVAIAELRPYINNAKKHGADQVDLIAKSIKEFGFLNPILIDKDKNIIAGHGRMMAAEKLGLEKIPCIYVEGLSEEQYKAYVLADNKLTELGEWDMEIVNQELEFLKEMDFDISLTGFDLDVEEENTEAVEDDFSEEVPEEPKAKPGDIYKLGNHRLMCGDSTNIGDVRKLVGGDIIDLIFTDPPYNVAFNGRSGKFDVIKNDNLTDKEFEKFIIAVINTIKSLNAPTYYIWCNWKFYGILQEKLDYKTCIVWAKNVFGMGKGYRHQHEFCLFNGTIDEHIKNESDLWEVKKDHEYVHPTQKPVELAYRALNNHKQANNIVDLFGGSGSTLIACEQLGRKCFMMEYDPKYVDVIISRWENFTGEKAELIETNNA